MADDAVLIAGGGIGGLAAALALANGGRRAIVLEQAREFGEIGAGIQLGPNAFKAIDELGILDDLRDQIVRVDALRMMDSVNNRLIIDIPLDDRIEARFGHPYAVVHRAHLHQALYRGCARSGLVDLRTECRLADLVDDSTGVTAALEDGGRLQGSALVGADGLWSRVRELLLHDGKPRIAGHVAYRALLEPDEMPAEARWQKATLWAGPRTHLVHYPISGGRMFNIVATFHSDREIVGWNAPGDRDELLHHFRGVRGLPRKILDRPRYWRRWTLCDRDPVAIWSRGRATLLGDAAHPMLQYFAQGSAMAMEDALVLAEQLDAADGDAATAFQRYQEVRGPRTARVQLQARKLGELYHMRGLKRWGRNWRLGRMTQQKFLDGIAWLYGGDFARA